MHATFSSRIRGEREESTRELGHLDGDMLLRGSQNTPIFIGRVGDSGQPLGWTRAPDEESEPDAEPSESDPELREPSQRVLRFELDPAHFERVVPNSENELELTVDARRFRYLEVRAELEIDGAIEASKDVGDVLDVVITRTNPPRVPEPIPVRLTDERGEPIPGANCEVLSGAELKGGGTTGTADGEGQIQVRPRVGSEQFELKWSTSIAEYTRTLFVVLGTDEQTLQRRLRNLGYFSGATVEDNVRAFQREFRREETGNIAHISEALIAWHDRGELPDAGEEPDLDNAVIAFAGPPDAEDRSDPSETEMA